MSAQTNACFGSDDCPAAYESSDTGRMESTHAYKFDRGFDFRLRLSILKVEVRARGRGIERRERNRGTVNINVNVNVTDTIS